MAKKAKTRQQLEDRVQDLREQLISNKRGVLDALEQRHRFLKSAREYLRDGQHVAWEREAGGRPVKTWRGEIEWRPVDEDSYRYDRDYEPLATQHQGYAEDQLAKIAEAVAMVDLTATMLEANRAALHAKDFWQDLFWPITLWRAYRSRAAA